MPTLRDEIRYRKVSAKIWSDERVRRLTPAPPGGQFLWFYLLTGKYTTALPGLINAGSGALGETLKWGRRGFFLAWKELEREQLAEADWPNEVIWVPNAVKHNEPANPNVVKSWRALLDQIPGCDLKQKGVAALRAYLAERGEPFLQSFDGTLSNRLPNRLANRLANQDQDQDQDQEQEQEIRRARAAVGNGSGKDPSSEQGNRSRKPKGHDKHQWCDAAYEWCVPPAVHQKLVNLLKGQHGGDREIAGRALLAWYPQVVGSQPPGTTPPADAFKFWSAQFDAAFSTAVVPASNVRHIHEPRSNVPGVEATRRERERVNRGEG